MTQTILSTSFSRKIASSQWCTSKHKRFFDAALAVALVALTSPLVILVALIVKLSSPGPMLFVQTRMGMDGRFIRVLKFRTMIHTRDARGTGLTAREDPRVTPAGAVLRKLKLDEIPQLFNVVCGDMSLVGPRPDLPEFISRLSPVERNELLRFRPGVTSPASLYFRDEQQFIGARTGREAEDYYVKFLMPKKIDLDMEYMRTASFCADCRLLWTTLRIVLFPRSEGPVN